MDASKFYTRVGIGIIALGLIMIGGIEYSKASELETFTKQVIVPVVQLERNCSGVVFNTSNEKNTYIVTANHCVAAEGADKHESGHVNLDVKSGQKLIETNSEVFDVIQRSIPNDLAVLKLRKEGLMLEGAQIATQDPVEGERVWTVGYPLGLSRTVTDGYFGGHASFTPDMHFDEFGNGRDVYRATPPIYGGNSGGGMFKKVDDHYELVGITDAGVSSFFVAGFYNTQGEINEIISNALKNEVTDHVVLEGNKKND